MIIQPSHSHYNISIDAKPIETNEKILEIFLQMLQKSEQPLKTSIIHQTERIRRFYEEKVYLSHSDDASQYLLHMLHKSQSNNGDQVAELVLGRQSKIVTAIKNSQYDLRINNNEGEKLNKMKDELTSKIDEMKQNFNNLEIQGKDEQKSDQVYKGFMEFRKRGYWNEESEQTKKVRDFLGKMKKEKKRLSELHERNLQKSEQAIEQEIQRKKKEKVEEQRKLILEISQRRQKLQSQRKSKAEEHEKKVSMANSFVEKYKSQKPIHILNQQKFKKEVLEPMQQQKLRKLTQIKKNRKPLDLDELELHSQRYEQLRQKMRQASEKKGHDQQLYEKNQQKLKELYHSRFHEQVEQQMNSYHDMVEEKKKMRERINSYSSGVKDQHKPKVDIKKKEELESIIKLLERKQQEKGKKKIVNEDGSVTFEEITLKDQKKIGISYLEHLRHYNQSKKHKQPEDRSSSMIQLSKQKIQYPDYLQQLREKSKSRIESASTRSKQGWKKIISQEGFTNREKYHSVMDHVSLLENEARQKELELKYMKGGAKAMELKEKVDQYYLESVAAKMHILKDVILKD